MREAEEAERVNGRLAVGSEVPEERVGQSVPRRPRVSARVEGDASGVCGAPVLVNAVAVDERARLKRVVAVNPRQVVAQHDVCRRRDERARRACEARKSRDGSVRYAVLVEAARGEELLELEAVGLALPEVARGRDVLRDPGGVHLRLVDECRVDEPSVRDLIRSARPHAETGDGRELRGDEGAERVNEDVAVVYVATVDAVLRVEAVVETQNVLSVVERVRLLEDGVVADGRVREAGRQPDHRAVDVCDCRAVGGDAARGDDVSERDVRAAEASGPVRRGARLRARRVFQHAVVRRADYSVGPAQAEREVAVKLRQSRDGAHDGRGQSANLLPLLPAEEEELVALDGAAEAVAEVVVAKRRTHGREEVARVQFVVAQELEGRAVEIVAAGFGDDVDLRAGVPTVLGGEVRRLDFHLVNEVNADVVYLAGVAARLQVSAAVNGHVRHLSAVAVD